MSDFERLHPALQHHIVNSLGWRELRPLQEQCIAPVLEGMNLLLLAPTAGGKTEAALFPILSQMIAEEWRGLSVAYLCPIKALLNNLSTRLEQYCGFVGRTSGLWHGDTRQVEKAAILKESPDILLTTPESLQVLLTSARVEQESFFSGIQCVVVDELHAFAGDDRGWQLLAVIESLQHIAGRDLQRFGLSATVGNPKELLEWLCGTSRRQHQVIQPPQASAAQKEKAVEIDYVGTLQNAALVISRLHRGEKRLVFCDSRSRVETLAGALREHGVNTFVSHSSLSLDERRRAEAAFSEGNNCVIVATSTLELGIDVGDLDRVIQIDSPATVGSFLQRLGRTGRRSDKIGNCLFLATTDAALLQATALVSLWEERYVEPTQPPPLPYHVLMQQILCLVLRRSGVSQVDLYRALNGFLKAVGVSEERFGELLRFLQEKEFLFEDSGLYSLGPQAEQLYGAKNFMALYSVFDSPPLFIVRSGRDDIGVVHEFTFWRKTEEPTVLSLGGRSWLLRSVDWKRKVVYVEETKARGRSIWLGSAQWLSYELCQKVKAIIASEETNSHWSKRAAERISEVREGFAWLANDGSTLRFNPQKAVLQWWTFAGGQVNSVLAGALTQKGAGHMNSDNLAVTTKDALAADAFLMVLDKLRANEQAFEKTPLRPELLEGLKFHQMLPAVLVTQMLRDRLVNTATIGKVLGEPVRTRAG